MPRTGFRTASPLMLLFAPLLLSLWIAAPAIALETAFTVTLERPWNHLIDVEMRVSAAPTAKPMELAMPVWTPGSYMVREYARHVQDFAVTDRAGKPLPWRKTRKNIWQVENGTNAAFVVRYKVYANELTVRTNEFDDTHAFWNHAALLMHPVGGLKTPSTLTVKPMPGWTVATGLEPVAGQTNTFRAPDYDTLYDCPVLAGNLNILTFSVQGKPHRIAIDGEGNYDAETLKDGVQRIVETEAEMMGELPYNDYTFLLILRPDAGGGLEHKNSTALGFRPNGFTDRGYISFFSLVAHEFFHLWNVKRIKPDTLGPFDYGNENYTRSLWIAEGITSYYDNLLTYRAGLMNENQLIGALSGGIRSLESTPGRQQMSLEEASFDAWIKEYRPDENSVNTQISYYTKGSVVAMLLDFAIRARTEGAKSLDDVMRAMWVQYGKAEKNYSPQDFQRVCEQVAGGSLEPFFDAYVRGRRELDYEAYLKPMGITLRKTFPNAEPEPYFGARLSDDPAGAKVSAVPFGTPAFDQGISVEDIIVAVDDRRVTGPSDLDAYIETKNPGDSVVFFLFRGNRLRQIPVKLAGRAAPLFALTPQQNLTDAQTKLLRDWMRPKTR
ncbi:MAG: PDZ domain-containing protein [Armatimonadaceae bacterium]